ncbi:hypothetical protein [Moorena sp. SIO4A1]|uniref:oxidoreductase n=1 Tax=Moorena sp. SIO4A1 TaxID=2607835 RepID=UPI00344F6B1F
MIKLIKPIWFPLSPHSSPSYSVIAEVEHFYSPAAVKFSDIVEGNTSKRLQSRRRQFHEGRDDLFSSVQLASYSLPNRMVMAPMTRLRANGTVPTALMGTYYTQRATAGLIITECTMVSHWQSYLGHASRSRNRRNS